MKHSFYELFMKMVAKVIPPGRLLRALGKERVEDMLRSRWEKLSDKQLDRAIDQVKNRDICGGEDCISALEGMGITLDVMLEWLGIEKFLREHRRKYHREMK